MLKIAPSCFSLSLIFRSTEFQQLKRSMLDQFSLANKTAMITGASRGLGQAMAIALANAGAFVICCSSSEGGTKQTIQQIEAAGGRAAGLFADLSNRQAVKETLSRKSNHPQLPRAVLLVRRGARLQPCGFFTHIHYIPERLHYYPPKLFDHLTRRYSEYLFLPVQENVSNAKIRKGD